MEPECKEFAEFFTVSRSALGRGQRAKTRLLMGGVFMVLLAARDLRRSQVMTDEAGAAIAGELPAAVAVESGRVRVDVEATAAR